MNRRLLIIEPDPSARALFDRVLTAAGYTAEDFEAAAHARLLLDDQAYDLAVVDELAGGGFLADVAFLRAQYPRLPLVVTGTMLSASALLELMRLGVADALPKPFTPPELRAAVARVLASGTPSHLEAVEFAAAISSAREQLAAGELERAGSALARAYAQAPLDAEIAALQALRAELEGRDADAARGYRAALALRHDEDSATPDPRDGLARLERYGAARPVKSLAPRFDGAPLILASSASEASTELGAADREGPAIVVCALSLGVPNARCAYLREHANRAFVLLTTDLRPESAAAALAELRDRARTHSTPVALPAAPRP